MGGNMTSPPDPVKIPKLKDNHKLLVGVILLLGAALVCLVFFSDRGLYPLYRFSQERLHLEQENARLKAENDRLARTIDRLQNDPELIQDLIRQELNFVKKNEIIFQLPPSVGAKPQPPAGPAKAESPSSPPSKPQSGGDPVSKGDAWATLPGGPAKGAAHGGEPAAKEKLAILPSPKEPPPASASHPT